MKAGADKARKRARNTALYANRCVREKSELTAAAETTVSQDTATEYCPPALGVAVTCALALRLHGTATIPDAGTSYFLMRLPFFAAP